MVGCWVHERAFDEAQTVSAGFHPWRDGSGDRHGGAFYAFEAKGKAGWPLTYLLGCYRRETIYSGRERSRFFVPGLWSRPVLCFDSCGLS